MTDSFDLRWHHVDKLLTLIGWKKTFRSVGKTN